MTHHSEPAEAVALDRRDISSPERSFWEAPHEISHYEADEAATRLINSHFKNDAERARVSIPANPSRDDDLIIKSYIRQQARLSASPAPAAGGLEAVREIEAIFRRHLQANDYAKDLLKRIAFDVVPAVRKALSAALAPSTSAATRWEPVGAEPELWSPKLEAIRLLAAEDKRQLQILELLETVREQIRLGVKPEHRPEGLMKNMQNAVYALRGRLALLNDAAIMAALRASPLAPAESAQVKEAEQERDRLAKLVESMIKEPTFAKSPHARMAIAIAASNVRRGRLLTSSEKFDNLTSAIEEDDPDLANRIRASLATDAEG